MPIDIDPLSNCATRQLNDIEFFINGTVVFCILSELEITPYYLADYIQLKK